jgi:hypothetical protein
MSILQEEMFRIDLANLAAMVKGKDLTEQFINLISEARKLSCYDDERKMLLTTGALIRYYGKESEIGRAIAEELDISITYIEDRNYAIDLRMLAIYLYIHCDNPHFFIPLWYIHQ